METILIIEDDETICLSLKYYLEQEKFQIMTCDNDECLNYLDKIDLILLDINLPTISGFDLFNKIKKIKDIPIIFLTAFDLENDVVKGLDMGADDYIIKPFKSRELLSRIRNVLRRRKNISNIINFGNVTIDLNQAKVFKNGTYVLLTSLEYKILITLALNPDKVFSREKLLADIWEVNEEYVYDNTLTVYIKRIRDKIEDNPNDPKIIITVRGLGYRIGKIWKKKKILFW